MIRNNNRILGNISTIFKSQVVDSYLQHNASAISYLRVTTTGLTTSEPLQVYYESPTEFLKQTYDTDFISLGNICFPPTGDNCIKKYYFCGNTEAVRELCAYMQYPVTGCYSGRMVCTINEFPNIESAIFNGRESDFNEDISFQTVPKTLNDWRIFDRGIEGDLSTIENVGNVGCWSLTCTLGLSGNFHDINFNGGLEYTCIQNLTSGTLSIDLTKLVNGNPNYTYSFLNNVSGAKFCADNSDISSLKTLIWVLPYADVKGDMSDVCFNTGMTTFCLTSCEVSGDMTNWNIDETQMVDFMVFNRYGNKGCFYGDLSGTTMPSTIQRFNLWYTQGVTSVPTDWGAYSNLTSLLYNNTRALCDDVSTWTLPPNATEFRIYCSQLYGNLDDITVPTGVTSIQFRRSCFTGNFEDVTYPLKVAAYYYDYNNICGNAATIPLYTETRFMDVSCNPNTCFIMNSPYNTCNLTSLNLTYFSNGCIDGDFNNFIANTPLTTLYICRTPVCSNLNGLKLNNITRFYAGYSSLNQDITTFGTTGLTNVEYLCINSNPDLCGDTTNWTIDKARYLSLDNTQLNGRLKHACPYCMNISKTNITSCIDLDFDFSVQSYNSNLSTANIHGNLGNVDLYYANNYQFIVSNNSNLCGSNEFTDKIFVNRKNFARSTNVLQYVCIADVVTGGTETLGSLGTYAGDPSGMDLTEEQVNNLVAGNDWDGMGLNTPWDSKNKLYWMKFACVSSSSSTKRYSTFNIAYST